VKDCLNGTYIDDWIGRASPVAWPSRSPDLNYLDYYLWGQVRLLVYEKKTNTRDTLLRRTSNAAEQIQNIPYVLETTTDSIIKRSRSIEFEGAQFGHHLHVEQLLYD
jgi:hypothetical protein